MQASRKRWLRIVSVLFLVLASLLAGILISRRFAIRNAVDACGSFHLSAEAEPFDIKEQIGTYKRTVVWIVVMKGQWKLSGGPLSENGQPESRTQYFDQCTVIVNAFTGNPLRLEALPLQTDTNE
jgi:hypothetical protein